MVKTMSYLNTKTAGVLYVHLHLESMSWHAYNTPDLYPIHIVSKCRLLMVVSFENLPGCTRTLLLHGNFEPCPVPEGARMISAHGLG